MNAVIVGASYAGLTAALELRRLLRGDTVTVILSPSEDFYFFPSLIWVIRANADPADIAFPIRPCWRGPALVYLRSLEAINPRKSRFRSARANLWLTTSC